jgi:hypothetical protein
MNTDQQYEGKIVTLLNGSVSSTSYDESGNRLNNGQSVSVEWNLVASVNVKRGNLIVVGVVSEEQTDAKSTKKTSSKKSTEVVEEPIQEQTTPVEETKEEIVEEVSSDTTEVPEESVE